MTFTLDPEAVESLLHSTEVTDHIASIAEAVRDRAKEKAPVANVTEDAKPGALKESVRSMPDPDQPGSYLVGSDLRYAAYVEFGTVNTHAHPYLRPALDEVIKENK